MIDPKRHSGPLPLIVGVTGHRDIADDDVAAVREMIGKVLASLRESFPWSEIQLLTALAEGADQLAAEVAVSLGVPLIAVSPMPLAAYEATFAADAGRKTLRRLWSAALTRMELPPVADAPGGMLEKLQYEQAGLVISRTSHVLLALWNGLEAWEPGASEAERLKMQGGTAHIVYLRAAGEQNSQVFRQSRIFPERAGLFDFGGNGPTLRVAAARQTVPGRAGAPGSLWQLRAAEAAKEIAPDTLAAVWTSSDPSHDAGGHGERETPLARLDAANRLMSEYAGGREDELERAKTFVLPLETRKTLGDQQPPVEMILNAYAHADIVAQSNQRNTNRAIFGLAAALPVAVLAFELYAHVWTKPEMLMVYLGVIVFAFALYFWGLRRGQWQNRFQDHRALAEALRVQAFWALSGVCSGVSDYYIRKHREEMSWIHDALRGPALWAIQGGLGPARPRLVSERWVKDQRDYFAGKAGEAGKARAAAEKYESLELLASIAYFVGLATAAALLAAQLWDGDLEHEILEAGVCLMGVAAAIAGALSIFAEKRAFKDHAHSYSRMGRLFARALQLLDDGRVDFTAVIRELGAEALAENGDWLLAHRDRKVEPIKGG